MIMQEAGQQGVIRVVEGTCTSGFLDMLLKYFFSCLLGSSLAVFLAILTTTKYWSAFVRRRHVPEPVGTIPYSHCADDSCYTNLPIPFAPLPIPERRGKQVTLIKEEATAALHQARRLTDSGRTDRALKLFRRALEADPSSPDVLTQYGNFIEMQEKNIIRAQQMYAKALAVRPDHTEAQTANERILPLVEEKDHKMFEKIDWKRGLLSRMPVTDVGFNRARRENYFLHVYHTLAIEGNTMTLSMTRSVLETGMAVQGKSLLEHNEVQGLGEALHFINQSLLYKGMIDLDDVLTLHLHVFGHVQPSEAGRFRSTQVFVGDYHPPPPENVPPFMKQFGEWLESREARTLHPIARAALDHYKLVWIHPFMDGNGRTARLLMNVRLMQNGYPPIIIKLDERHKYYQYLTEANEGDVQPFVRFIARITERAIDDYLNSASDSHLIPDAHSTENIVPP